MSENSKIEWCDHTFNPWVGCTKVSPACDHCYAETWAKRAGTPELWLGERRRTSPSNWRQPLKWNANHEQFYAEHGRRQRVFCASLADVFDNQVPAEWRMDLWSLIAQTPNLDWLLLTKRPQNMARMLPPYFGDRWKNIWLGVTVENQAEANRRIPLLIQTRAAIRFLSCEPLSEEVDLSFNLQFEHPDNEGFGVEAIKGIDWIIVGGESGHKSRPMNPDWARSLRDQCQSAGVPFFFKQWGGWAPLLEYSSLPRNIDNVGWFTSDGFCPHEVGAAYDGEPMMLRVWKKTADRMLDGREWSEFPEVRS
ncbi:MAG: phage Gp37/Gp68 family protein [Paenibacillaceae bacterium]|nr:phage Gp37/Gp68 family protein [Paenibacillaceae bacterium]